MNKNILAQINKIKTSANGRTTGFVIGNTSDIFDSGRFYEIPIRETLELIYGGVIVRDEETATAVAGLVDGNVEYVFVDDEKKIRKIYYGKNDVGNIEQAVRCVVKKSKLLTYKGNDLAVEATDMLLANIVSETGGIRVAVIGLGNLGSKIALKLVERGMHVSVFRRDQKKLRTIVDGLNQAKSEYTLAKITSAKDISEACRGAQVVIGVANEKRIITKNMLRYTTLGVVLIDAGKGCFADDVTDDASFLVYRLDISIIQKQLFIALIQARKLYGKHMGRRVISDLDETVISMGLFGRCGEVIVDDIESPSTIVGISAGDGSLEKNTPYIQERIDILRRFFKIN